MGGVDKGLVDWRGKPLAAWVMAAMAPVVTPVWLSVNRSLVHYRRLSPRLARDPEGLRWQGPLAGLLAGMQAAAGEGAEIVLVSPCDTPDVTPDLFRDLLESYQSAAGVPVVARSGERLHPLHGVYPVSLIPALEQRLEEGNRKVMDFVAAIDARTLPVGPDGVFNNINRLKT